MPQMIHIPPPLVSKPSSYVKLLKNTQTNQTSHIYEICGKMTYQRSLIHLLSVVVVVVVMVMVKP
ncbi:hypothetical protein E2C01_009296 [Portunus trituberculatus]|uniref:Uncharacterized protein n=1 Tax=Portunus trituberculatus TaxID=210409 RepID=A0A5B7D4T0_PORTR|nr:hypothetical protein [Portunus trituberculatus]